MNLHDQKYYQKSKSISSAEPNYLSQFEMRYPVYKIKMILSCFSFDVRFSYYCGNMKANLRQINNNGCFPLDILYSVNNIEVKIDLSGQNKPLHSISRTSCAPEIQRYELLIQCIIILSKYSQTWRQRNFSVFSGCSLSIKRFIK